MIAVMIIPTGLGFSIGGDAGDGNPACKLLAECCDTLITHPNVVNASDINEMQRNVLYVEGSCLDRFLEGHRDLWPVNILSNRILLLANKPVQTDTVDAANAARHTIGCSITVLPLETPLIMEGWVDCSRAHGKVSGLNELIKQIEPYLDAYDTIAIHSKIDVDVELIKRYFNAEVGVNPWGKVEAMVSSAVSKATNLMCAHAPMENNPDLILEHVPARMAAEAISTTYLQCVLKGLHRAPHLVPVGYRNAIHVSEVDCMISPVGCWGEAHKACREHRIPIIGVNNNRPRVKQPLPNPFDYIVANYVEAAGLLMAMRAGVTAGDLREN